MSIISDFNSIYSAEQYIFPREKSRVENLIERVSGFLPFPGENADIIHVHFLDKDNDHNLIERARENAWIKNWLTIITAKGYLVIRHQNYVTSLAKMPIIKKALSYRYGNKFKFFRNFVYNIEYPENNFKLEKMLVVFSSVSSNVYSDKVLERNFVQNFPSLKKYVPKNVGILRVSDFGGVVGGFYMNSSWNSRTEGDFHDLVNMIMEREHIKKNNILFYGASKGGTAAVYHACKMGIKAVVVDPVLDDLYYVDRYKDSHFTIDMFNFEKKEKFYALSIHPNTSLDIISSSRSPQYKFIAKFIDNKKCKRIYLYNSTDPRIKDHPDVAKFNVNILVYLINKFFFENNFAGNYNEFQ